jgi:hypothetical protein
VQFFVASNFVLTNGNQTTVSVFAVQVAQERSGLHPGSISFSTNHLDANRPPTFLANAFKATNLKT